MPFIGTGHVWILGILLIVVLIVWGPGKLPDVGSGMGRAIREFRKASSDTKAEFSRATASEVPIETVPLSPVMPVPPVAPLAAVPLTHPAAAEVTAGGAVTRAAVADFTATEGDHSAHG